MVWPFEYQGTSYFATANAGGSNRYIYIYKQDEIRPFKKFKFPGARYVKVRGEKILACGDPRCYICDIPTLLRII